MNVPEVVLLVLLSVAVVAFLLFVAYDIGYDVGYEEGRDLGELVGELHERLAAIERNADS